MDMESPPLKRNVGQDHKDIISVLPDDLLLEILERIDLRDAVRAGAASTRWRHLPNRLSVLDLHVDHFHHAARSTPVEAMGAFTDVVRRFLSASTTPANGKSSRAINGVVLSFYVPSHHLSSIARAVEDVVSRGETECLELDIFPPPTGKGNSDEDTHFMTFCWSYRVTFRWLTILTLTKFAFGHYDVTDLITACERLEQLAMIDCRMAFEQWALKIDTPCSRLQELDLKRFRCTRVDLVSVPKLRRVRCESWRGKNPPVHFGYVPELHQVCLLSRAKTWQPPFRLSECLSTTSAKISLSTLHLNFKGQMIWIQPEHPKQLTCMFSNLRDVGLFFIFPECDLSWTMFILEAAPAMQNFKISQTRHSCVKMHKDSAEKTNVVWEPSKDMKHQNLKLLIMLGFEDEDKVINYIRLVMERAIGLKTIELGGEPSCKDCDAIDPRRSEVDEASRRRIKERLIHGSSLSVEIVVSQLCHDDYCL